MKFGALIVLLIAFTLSGCGKRTSAGIAGGGSGTAGGSPANQNRQWRDVTQGQCGTHKATGTNAMGLWQRVVKSGDGETDTFGLQITDKTITLTNTCAKNNLSREATTGALPITLTNSSVVIANGNSLTVGDKQLSCPVALTAGTSGYKLVGNCLQINLGGKVLHYIATTLQ